MKTINASEFKAKCLALLDRVEQTGEGLTILKRGRPVARVVPAVSVRETYPQQTLAGTVDFIQDVIEPVLPEEAWEALKASDSR